MNALRLYGKMIAVSIRGQLQYRGSFIMMTLGNALGAFIEFLGIWALFGRFGTLENWSLAEAAVFFGMGRIAFGIQEIFMREFDLFHNRVRSGDFDRVLLRPRSTVLMMFGAQCQVMRVGGILQGVVVLVVGLSSLNVGAWWGAGEWTLMALTILGGACLFASLIVLQATACFWTTESLEIWNSITYGGVQLIQYPLDIYERPLRFFFMYIVPLAAMNYWPCSYLLGRGYVGAWLSWLSPGIGLACFLLSFLVWRIGVKHYRSTGS